MIKASKHQVPFRLGSRWHKENMEMRPMMIGPISRIYLRISPEGK